MCHDTGSGVFPQTTLNIDVTQPTSDIHHKIQKINTINQKKGTHKESETENNHNQCPSCNQHMNQDEASYVCPSCLKKTHPNETCLNHTDRERWLAPICRACEKTENLTAFSPHEPINKIEINERKRTQETQREPPYETDPNYKKPRHENKPCLKNTGKTKLKHPNTTIYKTSHNIKPEKKSIKQMENKKIKITQKENTIETQTPTRRSNRKHTQRNPHTADILKKIQSRRKKT